MKITRAQQQAFLEHIGLRGDIKPTLACLEQIVDGYAFSCPYETLYVHDSDFDVQPNQRSSLEVNVLFKKIVEQNRGGRCVELNYFLQQMLKSFGFEVTRILPQTLWHEQDTPKEQRPKHSAAIVRVNDKEYLVDAAFGGLGLLAPIELQMGEFQQYSEKFRLIKSKDYPFELQVMHNDKWVSIYGFDKTPALKKEYESVDSINANPKNPASYFKDTFLCTKPFKMNDKENGRYRVFKNKFLILHKGKIQKEEIITSQERLHEILETYFGIESKGTYIRHRELDMRAHLAGINRPPVLHRYPTRLKTNYLSLAQELNEAVEGYDVSVASIKKK